MRDDKTYELMKDNKIFFICIEARKCVKLGDYGEPMSLINVT